LSWPVVHVLGVRVDDLPLETLLSSFDEVIQARRSAVFAYVNIYAINLASALPWFRQFLNDCELGYCDGAGVQLGAWIGGERIRYRHSPADWFWALCERALERGYSMYFLGSRPGVAELAAKEVRRGLPGLAVSGMHHGYFDQAKGSDDNRRLIQSINELNPDILVVAMGMPLQEAWIRDHLRDLSVRVVLPVGALLDYVSGRLRRPPAWMTRNGLEWLGRLILEPMRLWRRYLIGNPLFIWRVMRRRFGPSRG